MPLLLRRFFITYTTCAALFGLLLLTTSAAHAQQLSRVRLAEPQASTAMAQAAPLGRVAAQQALHVTFALSLRQPSVLASLLQGLYDPASPTHGHFLTAAQFAAQFGPAQADYNAVAAFARAQGLTVTGTHPNRLLLDVTGPARTLETVFGVRLQSYRARDGRVFHAPDGAPSLPASIARLVTGISGLNDAAAPHPAGLAHPVPAQAELLHPAQVGSGIGGGLSPADVKTAYNINGSLNGSGQTLAVVEFDGYRAADTAAYAAQYGLPAPTLQNVLVDGYDGHAGASSGEVTLDIELQMAMAPAARKIIIYEGVNLLTTLNRVATDNQAKQISVSWGINEGDVSTGAAQALNAIYQQMAAQGQTLYVSSGDNGAYNNGTTLSVNGLASPPYACGVGGTSLSTAGPGGAWRSESTWTGTMAGLQSNSGGSGGGVSAVWARPDYQNNVGISNTARNLPDVSLDADPGTGYSIYWNGGWWYFGGTSAAAPLWAGFTALVNQQRANSGQNGIGFINPSLYRIGTGSRGAQDFHDIADGSNNLYYHATPGYDNATGWGSMNGANLLADLTGAAPPAPPAPAAPTGLAATGSNGAALLCWSGVAGATQYTVKRSLSPAGPFAVAGRLTGCACIDGGLTNNSAYYYVVSATGTGGESADSSAVGVIPFAGIVGSGCGLTGQYFAGRNFDRCVLTRTDSAVNFGWNNYSPAPGLPKTGYTVRWTGQALAAYSGTYTFTARASGGVRLWVNGQLLFDGWRCQTDAVWSGSISLIAGQRYDIRMEYLAAGRRSGAQLCWSSPNQPAQIVPPCQLYPAGAN